jgi:quercetin dioxygenase-like cupin family protein
MSILPAKPGDIIDLRPLGRALATAKTTTLVKTADLELIQLGLPAGKEIPTHKAPGEITVQCLEGRVAFTAEGKTQELTAGQLLYLAAGERHAVRGFEDSSLLLTILLPNEKPQPFDVVQESSEESFPASDPPADHRH